MKKLFTLTVLIAVAISVFSQPPQKMSYQAVVRTSGGQLVTNHAVGMRISILQGSATGTAVYVETHMTSTNANGLATVEIGGGTIVTGTFTGIDWSTGTYFIKTETDPAGGTSYTITGTSQILSVPYALYAKKAGDGFSGNYNDLYNKPILFDGTWASLNGKPSLAAVATSGSYIDLTNKPSNATTTIDGFMSSADKTKLNGLKNVNITAGTGISVTGTYPNISVASNQTHYLGEEYLGGIIFYLYSGSDGQQHGLVVSKTESTGTWSGSTLVGADRTEDGTYNTNLMPTGSTAKTWVQGLGAGWYLPSIDELNLLWHNRYHVNKTARAIASTLLPKAAVYWSSTEYSNTFALIFQFLVGQVIEDGKGSAYNVRAIRSF